MNEVVESPASIIGLGCIEGHECIAVAFVKFNKKDTHVHTQNEILGAFKVPYEDSYVQPDLSSNEPSSLVTPRRRK